jgi:hypothetical protein
MEKIKVEKPEGNRPKKKPQKRRKVGNRENQQKKPGKN